MIQVRSAAVADAGQIARIHVDAWRAAYEPFMSKEYLASLSIAEREAMWQKALGEPGKGSYLVAETDQAICGFCVHGPARDADLPASAAELVAMNVAPAHWRSGSGSALMRKVIADASDRAFDSLYLWVIEGNTRAIGFYEHFGFVSEGLSKVDDGHCGMPVTEVR